MNTLTELIFQTEKSFYYWISKKQQEEHTNKNEG